VICFALVWPQHARVRRCPDIFSSFFVVLQTYRFNFYFKFELLDRVLSLCGENLSTEFLPPMDVFRLRTSAPSLGVLADSTGQARSAHSEDRRSHYSYGYSFAASVCLRP
jgi:hypothetical protein